MKQDYQAMPGVKRKQQPEKIQKKSTSKKAKVARSAIPPRTTDAKAPSPKDDSEETEADDFGGFEDSEGSESDGGAQLELSKASKHDDSKTAAQRGSGQGLQPWVHPPHIDIRS